MDTPEKNTTEMSYKELRQEFRTLRRNSEISATHAEWEAAVGRLAYRISDGAEPTPAQWVEAARRATTECDKCHGTGVYVWGGTINGKPMHTGTCYRCEGKGCQNQDDYRRNFGHTRYAIASAI